MAVSSATNAKKLAAKGSRLPEKFKAGKSKKGRGR
jgi:hypothetical protein